MYVSFHQRVRSILYYNISLDCYSVDYAYKILYFYVVDEANLVQIRGDQRLRNNLIDKLQAIGVKGWSRDCVGTTGERCIRILAQAFWYIDAIRN